MTPISQEELKQQLQGLRKLPIEFDGFEERLAGRLHSVPSEKRGGLVRLPGIRKRAMTIAVAGALLGGAAAAATGVMPGLSAQFFGDQDSSGMSEKSGEETREMSIKQGRSATIRISEDVVSERKSERLPAPLDRVREKEVVRSDQRQPSFIRSEQLVTPRVERRQEKHDSDTYRDKFESRTIERVQPERHKGTQLRVRPQFKRKSSSEQRRSSQKRRRMSGFSASVKQRETSERSSPRSAKQPGYRGSDTRTLDERRKMIRRPRQRPSDSRPQRGSVSHPQTERSRH